MGESISSPIRPPPVVPSLVSPVAQQPLSSLFDLATFGLLLWVFHVDVATFRAAWFIESMATQILVVFVILLFLLVFLYRSLMHGELPKTVQDAGPNGATSPERQRGELQTQIDELDTAVKRILRTVEEGG